MIKKVLLPACVLLILATIAGCTKSNPTIFYWDYQGSHYIADSSSVYNSGSDIRIAAVASTSLLGIDCEGNAAVGTYAFHTNNSGQTYMFYDFIGSLYSSSGTLNITYNDGKKMSGNFSVTYTDGTAMSGSFTDIPFK